VFAMDFNAKAWDNVLLVELTESTVLTVLLLSALFFLLKIKEKNRSLRYEIAERLRAEEALWESNEQFRHLFKGSRDGIVMVDDQGCFLNANPAYCDMLGYGVDELKSIKNFNTITPEKWHEWENNEIWDKRLMKDGYSDTYEKEYIRKDGTVFPVEIQSFTVFDQAGSFKYIWGIARDITKRKRQEAAIKESEIKYRELVENSPDAIVIYVEGKIDFANKECLRLVGATSAGQLIGKPVIQFVHPEYRNSITRQMKNATNEGVALHLPEEKFLRLDGSDMDVEVRAMPIRLESKPAVQLIIRDITESKLAEKQLKLLSKAVEQSSVTILITDIKGNIEYVNPKFTKVTGFTLEEVKGKNPRILKSGEQPREFFQELWKTLLSGNEWVGEFHNKKKNGESYWESSVISSIRDNQGVISSFIAVQEDITEKKKMLEELIEAKDRAEESGRLKTAFLNNISHEIRTPFNGLLGFLPLLQDENLTSSERAGYIHYINQSAERLMNTIDDIVEISQIQAGQTKLTVTEIAIKSLSDELTYRFRPEAESKGLEFTIRNSLPGIMECISTDSIKLNTILSNLINNAIKFTKAGSIELEYTLAEAGPPSAPADPGMAAGPAMIKFSVKDTGIGIPSYKHQAIFERFIQADVSSTRQFEGSGLGLSIAKAYVKMLGGNIWVESEPGKGAVFYFTILSDAGPEGEAVMKNAFPDEETGNRINLENPGLKILVVEDDETSEMLISIVLKEFGKQVLKVRTGREAIEACRINPDIDLVMMDIKMPEMNGYEATRQIRKFNKDVVIIAQTAYALVGDREKAMEAGCNDYIAKPLQKEGLMKIINRFFN